MARCHDENELTTWEFVPMRKLICALAVMFAMAGLVVAAEVTAFKYDPDNKELSVKDADNKELVYKLSGKEKITSTDKDGGNAADVKFEDFEARLKKQGDKLKMKIDITTDKDNKETITEMKYKKGKGKN
jgi:hypothetical protein